MSSQPLAVLLRVSIHVGEYLVVDHMFRSFFVTIQECDTRVDLVLLDMLDFDVILGIDYLFPYHTILDCFSKNVTLTIHSTPLVVW